MADNTKQGPKDITDLKARLGLKKQGGGVPAPGPAGAPSAPFAPAPIAGPAGVAAPRPSAGGPVPAPGPVQSVPVPGGFPPPPGFAPPPEAAPPAADPRRDPYAAQQAALAANMASFYGAGALPGNADDVKPDSSKKPPPWGLIGGAAVLALAMFGVGAALGSISVSRGDYNVTTEQAVKVRDEAEKIQKQVEKVRDAVKEIKLSDKEPPNFAAIEKLAEIDFKEPDITRNLFHTNYASFEPSVVQQLFTYYNDVIVLAKLLNEHSIKTMKDKDSIEKYVKGNAGKQERGPIGVILDYSQKLPRASLVELGALMCPTAGQTDCAPEEAKLKFRTSLGGEYQQRGLKGLPQNTVFAIEPTELQKQLMSGDPGMLAFRDYVRRAAAMFELLRKLQEEEKQLVQGLKKRAEAPKLFAL